jgi:hypothetical protein
VTGKRGIALHRLHDDREIALASLDRLEAVDANVVLPRARRTVDPRVSSSG